MYSNRPHEKGVGGGGCGWWRRMGEEGALSVRVCRQCRATPVGWKDFHSPCPWQPQPAWWAEGRVSLADAAADSPTLSCWLTALASVCGEGCGGGEALRTSARPPSHVAPSSPLQKDSCLKWWPLSGGVSCLKALDSDGISISLAVCLTISMQKCPETSCSKRTFICKSVRRCTFPHSKANLSFTSTSCKLDQESMKQMWLHLLLAGAFIGDHSQSTVSM